MEKVKARLFRKDYPSYDLFTGIAEKVMRMPYSLFFDGGRGQFPTSRYSFLALDPFLIFKCTGERVSITGHYEKNDHLKDPFKLLDDCISRYEVAGDDEISCFTGGAAGYIGYDMGRLIEEIPSAVIDDIDIPDAVMCFYASVIVADHVSGELYAAASGLPETDRRSQKKKALADLDFMLSLASGAVSVEKEELSRIEPPVLTKSNFSRQDYKAAVKRVKKYIASGDVYQVNVSQRFECACSRSPFSVYDSLRRISPAPYSCFFNCEDFHILCSSPEAFLKMDKRRVVTRPIKGTRPRGKTSEIDQKMKADLLKSVKDRAELLMITDLERNDLGRVCKYGSVHPKALFELEAYSNVYHLVSTITGELDKGKTHVDCLRACFPGGSITGAPKIRSMEIIEELERCRRKIYTGSIGYFGFNRISDFNIAIRTILHKNGSYYFSAGGGIVADSDPEMEYEETLHKAKGIIEALNASLTPANESRL